MNTTTTTATQRPRDAATVIIVDGSSSDTRILMGKRRQDQVFMPGKYVFPGGRVDPSDKRVVSADELDGCELKKLLYDMKGHASAARARAIAIAGIREVFEETGFIIGKPCGHSASDIEENWKEYFAHGYTPSLSGLCFFARAITPPGRPRRYDTRFFCVSSNFVGTCCGRTDDELSDIDWYTIEQCTSLDLPPITRVVLEDLSDRLRTIGIGPSQHAVPYYHQRRGLFYRELIDVERCGPEIEIT